jgi:hypothetical protein
MSIEGLCFYDSKFSKIRSQIKKGEELIGEFSLNLYSPYQLEVSIEEEYQGKGLSTKLLQNFGDFFCEAKDEKEEKYNIKIGIDDMVKIGIDDRVKIVIDPNVIIAIDADASENEKGQSWWGKIGMRENRHSSSSNRRGIASAGYEKTITLRELLINISKIGDKHRCFRKRMDNKTKRMRTDGGNKEEIKMKYTKNINGKEKAIYKKIGDRKEYIKIKGELKYAKDYKGKKVK